MNTIAIMVATNARGVSIVASVGYTPSHPMTLKGGRVGGGGNLECHVKNLKLLSLLVIVDLALFFHVQNFGHVVKICSLMKKSDSWGFWLPYSCFNLF